MTKGFQRSSKRYVNVLGVLLALAVGGSILLYSGCGMVNSPNIPETPTPTPTPIPTPTPTPDTQLPTSTITFPTDGLILGIATTVIITGTASDTGGGSVARVEVSVDNATWQVATGTGVWSFNWTPPPTFGLRTLRSRAVDTSGNVQEPPAQVTVTTRDATPPTSTITSPIAGATVSTGTTVTITGTASDTGGGSVVGVEISFGDGIAWFPATGTSTWSFNWTPTLSGQTTIKSRAIDTSRNYQDPPTEVTVTVKDATPPTSRITSPKGGAPGTTVNITGTASDAGGGTVVRVEVSVDGGATYNTATGTTAWSYTWTTPTTPGLVTIKSRAVDDSGNVQDPPAEFTITVRFPITIRVPSDQPTIQAAINAADYGDVVLVAPGTYVENINFGGKAITVTSESGPQNTIIDGGNRSSVVSFTSGEERNSVLNSFMLQNGSANFDDFYEGGGISIRNSSPTITNNMISNNRACTGGGIGIGFGSPLIQSNTITGNNNDVCSGGGGGGISIRGDSNVEIFDNVISDNGRGGSYGGGIYLWAYGQDTPIIKRNVIKGNMAGQGGGIYISAGLGTLVVQNLITGNKANEGGGLYWLVGPPGPILVNNTIADNDASIIGSGILAIGYGAQQTKLINNIIVAKPGQVGLHCGDSFDQYPPITRFNNTFSAGGMASSGSCSNMTGTDGNISADPLFADPTQGDYHLQPGSPSIDSSDNLAPNLPDTDIDGDPRILDGNGDGNPIVDMGVDEFRRTIRVPSDQPTIQAAINVANDGDRVLVAPGTYFEHIDFSGKSITVTSESGPQLTIIDAGNTDPVVRFTSGEGRDSVLNGFTLQNGRTNFGGGGAPPDGGGIVIQSTSPTITNNVITNNHASRGSGIGIVFGSPLIQLNTITANINDVTIGGGGGGILISGEGSAEILDNVISNNVNNGGGGGIYISGAGATPIIKRNVIKGNSVALGASGGGIYTVNNSSPLIVQNLITGNQASNGGGIFWLVPGGVRGPILVNNTIADNDVTTNGSGIFADGVDSQVELTNNIIVAKPGQTALYCGPFDGHIDPIIRFNNIFSASGMAYGGSCADSTGTDGNISADPLFTNPTQGDYHLQQGSPSIDAGDNLTPNLPDKDLDGDPRILDGNGDGNPIVDMGVDEFLAPSSFDISLQIYLNRRITTMSSILAGDSCGGREKFSHVDRRVSPSWPCRGGLDRRLF
jgi:Right handed beta helix region/Bacterial Ig domain/Domain of unknown function (DUF5123)